MMDEFPAHSLMILVLCRRRTRSWPFLCVHLLLDSATVLSIRHTATLNCGETDHHADVDFNSYTLIDTDMELRSRLALSFEL